MHELEPVRANFIFLAIEEAMRGMEVNAPSTTDVAAVCDAAELDLMRAEWNAAIARAHLAEAARDDLVAGMSKIAYERDEAQNAVIHAAIGVTDLRTRLAACERVVEAARREVVCECGPRGWPVADNHHPECVADLCVDTRAALAALPAPEEPK